MCTSSLITNEVLLCTTPLMMAHGPHQTKFWLVFQGIPSPNARITKLSHLQEQHYPNLDRPGFNGMEHSPDAATEEMENSPESSTGEIERFPKPATSELKQLCRYFTMRLQLLHSLGSFYKDTDLAYDITQGGDLNTTPSQINSK